MLGFYFQLLLSPQVTVAKITECIFHILYYSGLACGHLVTIEGHDKPYSILKRPPKESKVVSEARKKISMSLDFQDMSQDLILIAKFFQLAEYGLVEYPALQGKVKSSEITILLLTDEADVAFTDFARVSERVLDNLEATYYYLNKGWIEMALKVYTRIYKDAEKMAKRANTLYDKYDSELKNLKQILDKTFNTQDAEQQKKRQADAEKRDHKVDLERLYAQKEEAHKKFLEMDALFLEAKRQERKALKKSDNLLKIAVNTFMTVKYGVQPFDLGSHKDAAKAHRAAKEKFFEEREKVRDAKAKIVAEIAEFAQRMRNADEVKDLANIAIEALQKVIGRLQGVITVLANTVRFWNKMTDHLDSLKESRFMQDALEIDNKTLQEEIISDDFFKQLAIENYARWVATYEAMIVFRQNIKPARKKMANIVIKNLSKEEALEKIQEVGREITSEEWRDLIGMDTSGTGRSYDEL